MFRTIKSKIILTVLVLILSIQVVSAVFQYIQVRSLLYKEFILGAQGLSQSTFIDLRKRISSVMIDLSASSKQQGANKEAIETIDLFVSIIQPMLFGEVLNSREDLTEIDFINANGVVVTTSYKKDKEIVHYNKGEKKDLAVSGPVMELVLMV